MIRKVYYIDLGIHKGRWAIPMIELLESLEVNYKVFGFEPCKNTFAKVKKIFENNLNVTIINKAIYKREEKVKLFHAKKDLAHSLLISHKECNSEKDYEVVDGVVFSNWFYKEIEILKHEVFIILKVNIEGAEPFLFKDIVAKEVHRHIDFFFGSLGDINKIGMSQEEKGRFLYLLDYNNICFHQGHANLYDLLREKIRCGS